MALPQIGLEAIFKDAGFQRGIQQFNDGINKATANAERGASAMSRIGSIAAGALTVGIGAAVTAFGALAAASKIGLDATLQWGEGLDKLGDMFGMSGEQASAFQYLANKVGLSIDEMGFGLNTLTRGLADMKAAQSGGEMTTAKSADALQNLKEQLEDANTQLARAKQRYAEAKKPTTEMGYAVQDAEKKIARLNADIAAGSKLVPKATKEATPFEKALKTLGVSAYNTKGKLKTFDEILPQIMDAFKKLPPSINKSDLAMTLFGARGGSKFLDFLSAGSDGLADATKKVKELGLEMSTTQVNAVEEFGFALNELKTGLTGIWNTIGINILPIAHQFVDYLQANVIPRLAELAQRYAPILAEKLKQLGDVLGYIAQAFGGKLYPLYEFIDKVFGRDVANNAANFMLYLQGIGSELGKLGTILKDKGLGDALAAWVGDIAGWLGNSKNTKPITDALMGWVEQFWLFLTDEKKGLLVTVADKMANLTAAIKAWSEDPKTQTQLELIGERIARTILEGIGNLFARVGESEDLLNRLIYALQAAYWNLISAFQNIGRSIASGIVSGAMQFFGMDRLMAQNLGRSITQGFQNAVNWMVENGTLMGIIRQLVINAWNNMQQLIPQIFGSGDTHSHEINRGYASGGFVPSTGSAYLHAGEYVLNRAQVMQLAPVLAGANNSRTYNISHTWNGAASSFERSQIEATVHAAMAEILEAN